MIKHRKKVDSYIRDKQVINTRVAHDNLKKTLNNSYDIETSLRAVRNQGSKMERRMDRVKESDYKEASRTRAAELKQQHVSAQESLRLNKIITANREANPEKWTGVP